LKPDSDRIRAFPRHPLAWREAAVPVLAILAVALLPLAFLAELPDPIAVHWGLDGRPDGSAPLGFDLIALVLLVALLGLVPLWAAGTADRAAARTLVALAHGTAVLLVALRWFVLQANRGVDDWRDAAPLRPAYAVAVLLLVACAAAFGWWVSRARPAQVVVRRTIEPTPTGEGEQLAWVGGQTSHFATLLLPVAVLAGGLFAVLTGVRGAWSVAATTVVVAGLIATVLRIEVAVGVTGLTVRFGALRWPRIHVDLDQVEHVVVEHVEPLAFGGWGYRWMPGVIAVVIRRGEAIRVVRRGARDLVVTVDGAQAAAGVLAAHLPHPDIE